MGASSPYREFHRACWEDRNLAGRMLDADPSLLDVRSGLGETVLHDSAIENGREAVEFLLSRGADPNAVNGSGQTALQECVWICNEGHDLTDVIRVLLAAGADPFHHSEILPCAWHLALRSEFLPVRELLGAIPAPADRHEICDLMHGVFEDDPSVIEPE